MTTERLRPIGLSLLDLGRKPHPAAAGQMLVGAGLSGLGLMFVFFMLFTEGHASFNTSSDVAWGAPIAYYLFFLLASSGLSVIASLDTVFGLNVFYPIAKRCVWLAIISLIAGFTILALEIGHPFRMLWALPFALQIHSPMWWMGVFYSIDLVLLCVKFFMMHRGDWHSPLMHRISTASFVVCILAPGTLGLVFGMMAMRPAWYSPIMPMYFILTGFVTAVAVVLFVTSMIQRGIQMEAPERRLYDSIMPRLFFVTLLAVAGMRFGQILTGLWSNFEGMEANWLMLKSPYFHFEIWGGLVLPLLLMSTNGLRTNVLAQFVASMAFMIGIFFGRLELLIIGQKVPLFKGYWAGYVDYVPSLTEWMLVPGGIGIFLFWYGAGSWLLRLEDSAKSSH